MAKTIIRQNKVKFIWAGDGPLLDVCKSRIGEYDRELIQFIGFNSNVVLLYREAIIYFQPSLIENHSISVIEAMAYGIPCIVSNVGGLPESVHDGVNGYVVDVTDKAAMVEKIEILLSDEKLRSKFGEESVKMINNKFSKAIWYKKMNNLHAKILCIR